MVGSKTGLIGHLKTVGSKMWISSLYYSSGSALWQNCTNESNYENGC
jgi:hypothetical protein